MQAKMGLCLFLVLAALASQAACQTHQKLTVLYKLQGSQTNLATLGTIDFDFNSGVNNFAVADNEAYTAIIKVGGLNLTAEHTSRLLV